jgi:hypothetical protein
MKHLWMADIEGPESVVLWSGAGLSADAPTGAPLGGTLAERALTHAFLDSDPDAIAKWFREARMPTGGPRLETVLGAVHSAFGDEAIDWLLSDLHAAALAPNDLHRFSSEHLAQGGARVTTNVDRCIEAAAQGPMPSSPLHIHGAIGEDGATRDVGVILDRVARDLLPSVHDELLKTLTAARHKTLIFVGYSGSDYFDVQPFLATLPARSLADVTVIWLEYAPTGPLREGVESDLYPGALAAVRLLQAAGAEARIVIGPSREMLAALSSKWGLSPVPSHAPVVNPVPWSAGRRPSALTGARRQAATLELYARLGLPNMLLAYLSRHPLSSGQASAASISEAFRTSGHVNAAVEWAAVAWPSSSADDVVMRHVSRIQALRSKGKMRKAERAACHLFQWVQDGRSDASAVRVMIAIDALTSVLFDRYRAPLGRRRRLAPRLIAMQEELVRLHPALDADLRLRVERIHRDLRIMLSGARRTADLDHRASEFHEQASSVIRALNYRQGLLRAMDADDRRAQHAFATLHSTWKDMGQHQESVRMMLSPMARKAVGNKEIWRTLRRMRDSGSWDRRTFSVFVVRAAMVQVAERILLKR